MPVDPDETISLEGQGERIEWVPAEEKAPFCSLLQGFPFDIACKSQRPHRTRCLWITNPHIGIYEDTASTLGGVGLRCANHKPMCASCIHNVVDVRKLAVETTCNNRARGQDYYRDDRSSHCNPWNWMLLALSVPGLNRCPFGVGTGEPCALFAIA